LRNEEHTKRDGSPAWGGQINSDGISGQSVLNVVCWASNQSAKRDVHIGGVNLQDKEIFPRLTLEMLMAWHHSYGSHKEQRMRV
jgi:hypothetical protein